MPPSILVVEDDPYLLKLYSKALRKSGFDVSEGKTLQEVRDQLKMRSFDLLLCDIHLSDGSAMDYLQEIAEQSADRKMEIVVASGDAGYRAMCEEVGIEFYLEKPISIRAMSTLIHRLLD